MTFRECLSGANEVIKHTPNNFSQKREGNQLPWKPRRRW